MAKRTIIAVLPTKTENEPNPNGLENRQLTEPKFTPEALFRQLFGIKKRGRPPVRDWDAILQAFESWKNSINWQAQTIADFAKSQGISERTLRYYRARSRS